MNYTDIYTQIDTEYDLINCDRFLDIEYDLDIKLTHEEINLYNLQDND